MHQRESDVAGGLTGLGGKGLWPDAGHPMATRLHFCRCWVWRRCRREVRLRARRLGPAQAHDHHGHARALDEVVLSSTMSLSWPTPREPTTMSSVGPAKSTSSSMCRAFRVPGLAGQRHVHARALEQAGRLPREDVCSRRVLRGWASEPMRSGPAPPTGCGPSARSTRRSYVSRGEALFDEQDSTLGIGPSIDKFAEARGEAVTLALAPGSLTGRPLEPAVDVPFSS
jgi:hypothetical protein